MKSTPVVSTILLLLYLFLVAVEANLFQGQANPHSGLDCPFVHGKIHPDSLGPCNGVNRSTTQVWDSRQVFNITGRQALELIDAIKEAKGDCSKAVVDGKVPIPLLNIRFNSDTFRHVADTAIRTANLVSDLINKGACSGDLDNQKFYGDPTANMSDSFLYSVVRTNMQKDELMFGSGIFFLDGKYKRRSGYFAPYAYKKKDDRYLHVKDLSTSWGRAHTDFVAFLATLARNRTFNCQSSYFMPRKNQSASYPARHVTHAVVEYIDGLWGRPYFECSTTKAWLVGYFIPFFATRYDKPTDDPLEVMGVATVDIDLNKVDINQCDLDSSANFTYKIFAGTHHCKNKTTRCVHVPGGGFSAGSYRCDCKMGYYFPAGKSNNGLKYFNGTEIEVDLGKNNGTKYNEPNSFTCLKCREGCVTCVDDSPCIFEYDMQLRWIICGLTIFCIVIVFAFFIFVLRCKELKVIKSASPIFLMLTLLGAGLMYTEVLILFPKATTETCVAAPWFNHMGFVIMYGSVLLKTWRVSLIFKIKVAKRVKVSDMGLLRRLLPLIMSYLVYFVIWTVAGHTTSQTHFLKNKNVRFDACREDWWNHSIVIIDILLLFWGIHLCYTIRKAPTPFNESRYISWSIYNMTLVIVLLKLISLFEDDFQAFVQFLGLSRGFIMCGKFGCVSCFCRSHEESRDKETADTSTKSKRSNSTEENNEDRTEQTVDPSTINVNMVAPHTIKLLTDIREIKQYKKTELDNSEIEKALEIHGDILARLENPTKYV
eukprot:gene12065-13308_t